MFWKALKIVLKRFGPDKWCRNHKMEGFPPKKNNDSNQPMELDYLATQIDPYFKKKKKFIFSACGKTIFSCCSRNCEEKYTYYHCDVLKMYVKQYLDLQCLWRRHSFPNHYDQTGNFLFVEMPSISVSLVASAANCRQGALCSWSVFFMVPDAWGSRASRILFLARALFLACRWPLCVLTGPSLSVCTCGERVLTISIRGLPLWPYLTSISPQKALSPSSVTLGFGLQNNDFGQEDSFIHSTF